MKTITFPSGRAVPALGIGTWKMGEDARQFSREAAAIRRAVDLGMTLIDTAEMYGEGGAEKVVGEAVRGRREEVFIVSKVYPQNASQSGAVKACDRSLDRLGIEAIDLYLLHWRGSVPLAETLDAFDRLRRAGKILSFGVSNFDTPDMVEAWNLAHGTEIASNQILYNLMRRGPEHDLLPWCREHKVPVMAYSPVEQGRLPRNAKLKKIAESRKAGASQIAIAWLLAQPNVIVIPKAVELAHAEENRGAADITLTADELAALDTAFPRPKERKSLDML